VLLNVKACLVYAAAQECDALLQVEPTSDIGQRCDRARLLLLSGSTVQQIEGEDSIGVRRWVSIGTRLDCIFEAQVEIHRPMVDLSGLQETPRHQLPGSVIKYLMPSRYCQSDLFLEFTATQFGCLKGGALVKVASDWVSSNFTYDIFSSDPGTTATDSFA
ncbi:unnamed protein product, partial [Ectocarpus sp. 12 AP-2014]